MSSAPSPAASEPLLLTLIRALVGGVLMGLANLVPGISGGTMLLASGVYPKFIQGIAEVSTFKFKRESLLVLGVVAVMAGLSIVSLAGPVKTLVVEHRWIMYSLFIGLTLGGIPVVWALARPATGSLWGGAVGGFVLMAIIAWFQAAGAEGEADNTGFLFMFLAGAAGASAMILPGISGGYLLLVLGVYVTILGGIDDVKVALKAGDIGAAMDPTLHIIIPVGLGVLVGILAVSNLLKVLLEKFEKPTLGALLGFLVGAVIGLWPFQQGVKPALGAVFKGQFMTPELLDKLEPSKYPTEYFEPTAGHVGGALGFILLGFVLTALVARLGRGKPGA